MLRLALTAVGLLVAIASPADALCVYHGVFNAKTTVGQEFRDSGWVVRAHVMSADYHWSGEGDSWTLYHLKVVTSFKGRLPTRFAFYTERDSGGFYMDGRDAMPDFDGDYLLFLTRFPHRYGEPLAARGAFWVNYNCGQSKPWKEVTRADQRRLSSLKR